MLIILKDQKKKKVVPLKYLSNFFRSLEIPLINCKIHLELNWSNNTYYTCVIKLGKQNLK